MINRDNPLYSDYYHMAFDKRPRIELYDLKKDPHQETNVAGKATYSNIQTEMDKKLMKLLTDTNDPRVQGDGSRFDKMPYTFKKWKSE